MKLTNRAKSALATAGYSVLESSAISQLVAFAAQNSGLEYANYGELKSYNQEARSISQDWRRFKAALIAASLSGVTDANVIAEAPHAFSGRLTWHETALPKLSYWEYTTGQYFPTEYRKAAATLLEYATRKAKQSRPPAKAKVSSISDLQRLNEQNGGCWFEPSTMRFFRTRIESGILRGKYFITSDQRDYDTPRKFTARSFDDEGSVGTVGEFHEHDTKQEAIESLDAVTA